ncbi:STAS/SEC14 domain-containing protein [Nocardioides sp.]|uniref:STAS/SEC14 domain-containing protein n=1 Tax=Nocardioides sp. TaxID=35761 RepID=UPI002613431A|nr:STAS/SEC14 domain-containing protein [Nocardioides sp.]MDI6909567.1 STAS/SEC14 domain-containing protein [Nocardioides sp.]
MGVGDDRYQVSWDERAGIARTDWLPGARCDLALARAIDADIQALGHGRVLSLVDLRDGVQIDRDAREYFIDQNPHYRAVALVARNAPARMLANFFLGLKRGEIPVRMFGSEAEAIAWLQAQP